jgi:hypothetical protein
LARPFAGILALLLGDNTGEGIYVSMDIATIESGLEAFTSAISAAKALLGISGSPKNAEVANQHVSDVLAKLGEAREKYIALQDDYIATVEENRQLKAKLTEHVEAEPCPKCLRKGWHVDSSELDRGFGVLGISRRIYKWQIYRPICDCPQVFT